jgi:hypothetical protein
MEPHNDLALFLHGLALFLLVQRVRVMRLKKAANKKKK